MCASRVYIFHFNKEEEELRVFLSVRLTDFMIEDYTSRNIQKYINHRLNGTVTKLLRRGEDGGIRAERKKESVIVTRGELMIVGVTSPPTCQPVGICCLHRSTNYT